MIKKKKQNKDEEFLFIKIHKSMPEIMDEFCKETGVNSQDVGYQIGFIAGSNQECMMPLVGLNQLFFFAGVYYANHYKNKLEYKYRKEKFMAEMDKIKEELKKKQGPSGAGSVPSYMG